MRILVVEDDNLMRTLLRAMLAEMGFTDVTEADDGDTALTSCGKYLPDIILLDWEMPRLDGMTFISALRGMNGGNRVKIIMCTHRDDFADISHALDAGADDFIMKPFSLDILRSKIAIATAA